MRKPNNVQFLKRKLLAGIKNNKIKVIICCSIIFFCIILLICFFRFANNEQKLGAFYNFWSEAIFQCIIILLSESGIIALIKCITKKKNVFFLGFIIVCGTIAFFSLSGILKIQSLRIDEETNDSNDKDKADNNRAEKNKLKNSDEYIKIPYSFEEDPFFAKKREEYFGIKKGSLTENDEIINLMADVLFEDMQAVKVEDGGIPETYENCTQAAELLYETYTYQRDRDWQKENTYAVIISKENRIKVLDKAIKERINGDGEFQDSENRRIISVYFKDYGDEYLKDDNQKESSKKFKESVKWAMKSLYTAYANKNYKKMRTIYKDLDNSISALEQLDKINTENISDIRLCCEAYKLIIDQYLPC